jgi:hypothetical protein
MIDLSAEGTGFAGYNNAWGHMERGKLYVKIDDDVVWMADDTIPRIVTMKIQHPEYFMVSANIINSPLMGWVHYHMGALHPYLPEYKGVMDPPSPGSSGLTPPPTRKPWKYTQYPNWEGPNDWYFDLEQDPPYNGHRWLRLNNDTDLHRTPITEIEYATWGTGLKSWAIVAQEHYSFLENLLDDQLDLYKFKRVWLADYERLSINLMTLWADEVLENLPMDTVDEEWLTKVLPKRIGKSVAIESEVWAQNRLCNALIPILTPILGVGSTFLVQLPRRWAGSYRYTSAVQRLRRGKRLPSLNHERWRLGVAFGYEYTAAMIPH